MRRISANMSQIYGFSNKDTKGLHENFDDTTANLNHSFLTIFLETHADNELVVYDNATSMVIATDDHQRWGVYYICESELYWKGFSKKALEICAGVRYSGIMTTSVLTGRQITSTLTEFQYKAQYKSLESRQSRERIFKENAALRRSAQAPEDTIDQTQSNSNAENLQPSEHRTFEHTARKRVGIWYGIILGLWLSAAFFSFYFSSIPGLNSSQHQHVSAPGNLREYAITYSLKNSDAYDDARTALRNLLELRHQMELRRRFDELWERKKLMIPFDEYWESMKLVAEYEHWERESLMRDLEQHWIKASARLWQCAKPGVIYL